MASWSHAFWESVVSICCKLRNHQSMIVIDLRGKDRASGAIPGTAIIPAMDLLTEIGELPDLPQIVALFCQYSAHRAPTVAGCISLRKQHFQQREGGFRG